MLQAYPAISEILTQEWEDDIYLDSILRYIVLVYDPRSPLYQNEKDLGVRKTSAAEMCHFNMLDENVELIHNCDYKNIVDLITAYLSRFAKSKEWAAMCAFEYTYWESIKELMKPISGKNSREILDSVSKKAAIKEQVELDIKRIDALTRQFFGQDEEIIKRKRTTPENMAQNR